jgi:hypothetical protein
VNVARDPADFEDIEREYGGAAVREALDGAQHVGPGFAPLDEPEAERISISPSVYQWRDPSALPRRDYLYGFELKRQMVSAVVAPGAAGKTTYKVGRAICMATGEERFGHRVWNGPHRVWLWNLEDERLEVEKIVAAYVKAWGMDHDALGDRLLIDGADGEFSQQLKLAVEDGFGQFKLQKHLGDALIEALIERKVDYLDIDPFVSSHAVNENSNQAIDAVAKEWLRIAREANCAVGLAHHSRKLGGVEISAESARGAGAIVNAARSVLLLQTMGKETASNFGVAECDRKRYFSVYDDKNNKAPPAERADWYEFHGVGLDNADVGTKGPEDNIGTCARWSPPDRFAGITVRHLIEVQKRVDENPDKCRKWASSPLWIGRLIADLLDLDPHDKEEKKKLGKIIDTWVQEGALKVVVKQSAKREPVDCLEVGKWAHL